MCHKVWLSDWVTDWVTNYWNCQSYSQLKKIPKSTISEDQEHPSLSDCRHHSSSSASKRSNTWKYWDCLEDCRSCNQLIFNDSNQNLLRATIELNCHFSERKINPTNICKVSNSSEIFLLFFPPWLIDVVHISSPSENISGFKISIFLEPSTDSCWLASIWRIEINRTDWFNFVWVMSHSTIKNTCL